MGHKFSHLQKRDRYKIEALLNTGHKPQEIADEIHVHVSTIYREIKRARMVQLTTDLEEVDKYNPDEAEKRYRENLSAKGPALKIGKDFELVEYLEAKMLDKDNPRSPAAALADIKLEGRTFKTSICVSTLYSYIEKGVFLRLTNGSLPQKGDKKRAYHKVKAQKRPPKGESIEKRPEEIDERSTFGHWEMDTVVSARPGKAAILVLTERLTREEITAKLPDKSAASVVQALDNLEREWGDKFPLVFQTITVDNGSEFADCPSMERSALGDGSRTKLYYCHPYSSYERGSNENLNKMIRRWLPKGTNFDEIADEVIEAVTVWINNYPRKILGYMTADRLFQAHLSAILGAA